MPIFNVLFNVETEKPQGKVWKILKDAAGNNDSKWTMLDSNQRQLAYEASGLTNWPNGPWERPKINKRKETGLSKSYEKFLKVENPMFIQNYNKVFYLNDPDGTRTHMSYARMIKSHVPYQLGDRVMVQR